MSISVIVSTCGRTTLEYTALSAAKQLQDGDELIVVGSRPPEGIDCRFIFRDNGGCAANNEPLARGREENYPAGAIEKDIGTDAATGTHLMIIDDDDIFVPTALESAHKAIAEAVDLLAPHIFRMKYGCKGQWVSSLAKVENGETVLWGEPVADFGNIGGSMYVFPKNQFPTKWDHAGPRRNECEDYFVLINYCKTASTSPIWHREVVSIIKPTAEQIEQVLGIPRPTNLHYAPQACMGWDGVPR